MKSKRESGVELLRIILIFFVVTMHYFNPQIGGGLGVLMPENQWFANFLIAVSCCAVDCFILISGYFMVASNKRSISKPISLYLQLVVFMILGKLFIHFCGNESLGIMDLLTCFIPTNYFIVLYIVLYIVSPYFNIVLMQFSKKTYTIFLIIIVCLFSVYPFLMDILGEFYGRTILGTSTIGMYGSQRGYSIVNFFLLYCIGGYIRRFEADKCLNKYRSIITIVLSVVVIFLMIMAESALNLKGETVATSYLNPIVIVAAVGMFCFFKNLHFYNNVINQLAGAVLTCFLIQGSLLRLVNVEKYASAGLGILLVHLVVSFCFIFTVSFLLSKMWSSVDKMICKRIDKHIIDYGIN